MSATSLRHYWGGECWYLTPPPLSPQNMQSFLWIPGPHKTRGWWLLKLYIRQWMCWPLRGNSSPAKINLHPKIRVKPQQLLFYLSFPLRSQWPFPSPNCVPILFPSSPNFSLTVVPLSVLAIGNIKSSEVPGFNCRNLSKEEFLISFPREFRKIHDFALWGLWVQYCWSVIYLGHLSKSADMQLCESAYKLSLFFLGYH